VALTLSTVELRRVVWLLRTLQAALADDWITARPDLAVELQRLFRADFVGTTRWNSSRHCFEKAMCVGRDEQMARDYETEFQFCDPVSKRVQSRQAPTLVRTVIDPSRFRHSRYFNEFLRLYDTVEGLDLHVTEGCREIGDLRIWRGSRASLFEERDVDLLRLLEPAFAGAFRRRLKPTADLLLEWFPVLTRREAEVAEAVVGGHGDRQVAKLLGCSEWTVRTHLTHMFEKLHVSNRMELAAVVHCGSSAPPIPT